MYSLLCHMIINHLDDLAKAHFASVKCNSQEIKVEGRGEERTIQQQPNQVLHNLVGLVSCGLLLLSHDVMLGIDFHSLF